MVGWHHQFNGHKLGQTLGDGEGRGGLACCSPWGQEYWSGLRFPSPGDLPNSGIKPRSPALQANSLPSEPPGKPWVLPLLLAKEDLAPSFPNSPAQKSGAP